MPNTNSNCEVYKTKFVNCILLAFSQTCFVHKCLNIYLLQHKTCPRRLPANLSDQKLSLHSMRIIRDT